ncbi:MAG: DEAD/DEAH box helicase [Epsilonproteobacteria bacterium]|nr:DEAD/DEAH box helicase [Campylobacterota bacterium]
MPFSNLMLSQKLQKTIQALGYTKPTPIQQQAIPALRESRDILAISQTGTGKSASFILPMLENLPQREEKRVGDDRYKIDALILAPTRELVIQIHKSIERYSVEFTHKSVALYGGVRLGGQIKDIRAGANIAVATPARLLEHLKNRTINLSMVKIVVIDEADRLLEMGFIDDIKAIVSKLPSKRQSAMFSATFPNSIMSLAKSLLKNPITIKIEGDISAKEIKQSAYYINEEQKSQFLISILKEKKLKQTLVFVNTKRVADILVEKLKLEGINATAIHGDKSQNIRNQTLLEFKNGEIDVLIATDVVARGIDIKSLPLVINFELPIKNEEYIHRIGRTGRAKESGEAISLISAMEMEQFSSLEKLLDITIPTITTDGFNPNIKQKRKKSSKNIDDKSEKLKKAKELAQKMMQNSSKNKKSEKKSNYKTPRNRRHF